MKKLIFIFVCIFTVSAIAGTGSRKPASDDEMVTSDGSSEAPLQALSPEPLPRSPSKITDSNFTDQLMRLMTSKENSAFANPPRDGALSFTAKFRCVQKIATAQGLKCSSYSVDEAHSVTLSKNPRLLAALQKFLAQNKQYSKTVSMDTIESSVTITCHKPPATDHVASKPYCVPHPAAI